MAVKISREESDNTEEIKNIQQRIKNVSKVIKNVAYAIAQGIITETTRNMLIQAEDEKNMLKLQLAQEQLAVKNLINREMVVDWLRRYQHVDITDTEMCRSIIDSLIHKVIVYEDGHVILILSYSGKKINASLEGKALLDDLSKGTNFNRIIFTVIYCSTPLIPQYRAFAGFTFIQSVVW